MTGPQRDTSLDCTKGIAIFLVVLFHIQRGFIASGQLEETLFLRFADNWAYSFHVRTFFVVAGYLAFAKAGQWTFQGHRQLCLYYSYLLWSVLSWTLAMLLASQVNSPVNFQDLLLIPIRPIQHFWFILVLMIGTALLFVLRTPLALAGAIIACLILSVSQLQVAEDTPGQGLVVMCLASLPYIFTGALLKAIDKIPPVHGLAAILWMAALATCAWTTASGGASWPSAAIFPIALGGCYAAFVAGTYAGRVPRLGMVLALLGRHSFAIYILHVLCGAGTRIVLAAFLPGLPVGIAFLLSLIAAILAPMLLEYAAVRLRIAALLGLRPLPLWRPVAKPTAA